MADRQIRCRADITRDVAREYLDKYKSARAAARAIIHDYGNPVYGPHGKSADATTLAKWLTAALKGTTPRLYEPAHQDGLNRIKEMLDRQGIDVDSIGEIKSAKLKTWGVAAKIKDPVTGEERIEREGLFSTAITISPSWESGPKWPLIVPAPPIEITRPKAPHILRKTRVAIIYSDAQCGLMWLSQDSNDMEPMHDPAALEVSEQITADICPDEQDWIGDWTDWQHFSRWPKHPEMQRTLQPSIDVSGYWLARLCSAAKKNAKRMMLGSNHGDRPELSMLGYNMEAMGMKRAAIVRKPKEWPVHSEAFLLGFNELGIEYSGHYPGGEYFLLPDLVLIHAPPKRLEFPASVIHGHLHRLTRDTMVQHGYEGRRTYFQWDIGCLCQVGPSANRRRMMVLKVPSDRARTDWAQGIAVVEMVEPMGSQPGWHNVEQITIEDGHALFRGKIYQAATGSDETCNFSSDLSRFAPGVVSQ